MANPDEHRERILRAAFDCRVELLAYARSMLGNYSAAEDVVQEAFLVVTRKYEQFQEGTSMLAWCRSIVRIEVMRARQRYHRDHSLVERILDDAIDASFHEFQESSTCDETDVRKGTMEQCVEQLSDRASGVLKARLADNLSYPQIGEKLGMSIEAVRKALFRAKKQVRDCVESKLRTAHE